MGLVKMQNHQRRRFNAEEVAILDAWCVGFVNNKREGILSLKFEDLEIKKAS